MISHSLLVGLMVLTLTGTAPAAPTPASVRFRLRTRAVARVLDNWHQAASVADGPRYFGHFAEDGVFLGTDDGERWSVEEFRAYAQPHFSKGNGWTYTSHARHISFSPQGLVAWVDEKLDNDHYGRLRGTAVLRLVETTWKIAHYSMSFPVPNARTKEVVTVIRRSTEK